MNRKENPAEKGEGMMLAFYERARGSFRPAIFVVPMDSPHDPREPVLGRWSIGLQAARRDGMRLYFATYAKRYGFKHPEDPTRTLADGLPPYAVVTLGPDKAGDSSSQAH